MMELEFALAAEDKDLLQGQPGITFHDEEPSALPSGEGHEIGSRRRHQTSRLHKHTSAAGSRSLTETTPARVELAPFPIEIIRWDSILGIQCLWLARSLGLAPRELLRADSRASFAQPARDLTGLAFCTRLRPSSQNQHAAKR